MRCRSGRREAGAGPRAGPGRRQRGPGPRDHDVGDRAVEAQGDALPGQRRTDMDDLVAEADVARGVHGPVDLGHVPGCRAQRRRQTPVGLARHAKTLGAAIDVQQSPGFTGEGWCLPRCEIVPGRARTRQERLRRRASPDLRLLTEPARESRTVGSYRGQGQDWPGPLTLKRQRSGACVQLRQQVLADAQADVVADRPDGFDVEPGGVGQVPVEVALAGDRRGRRRRSPW